jgi:pectin methylesterase-like acyl-CoA thioesterase
MKVTGSRNVIKRCHIAGTGDDTNDIADSYSLYVSGAENLFEQCVIGLDTIDRGSAANSEIYLAAGCNRTIFRDCYIISRLQHSTNSPFVRVAGGSMGNPSTVIFDNCKFIATSTNYGFAQTYAFVFTAAYTAGQIYVVNCSTNSTNWGVAANHLLIHNSVSNTGYNQGLAYSS